ncbi:MAG TPA: HPr family phosphocarrier protein [Candidatus Limnocylindrales bacterium]|nr:HPr family phosphocarrier protein [Candidatus Limnocylindrales bacterium]
MTERRLVIADPAGLHARQAARLVQLANGFSSRITIRHGGREADARSLIEILGLAVGPSTEITLVAEGVDADEALAVLTIGLAAAASAGGTDPAAGSSSMGDA